MAFILSVSQLVRYIHGEHEQVTYQIKTLFRCSLMLDRYMYMQGIDSCGHCIIKNKRNHGEGAE